MTKDETSNLQKIVEAALLDFWSKVIEPNVALKSDVEEIKYKVDGLEETVNGLATKFDGLEETVNGLATKFDGLEETVNGLATKFDGLEEKVDGIDIKVNSIDRKLDAEISYRDRLEKRIQKLETAR